MSHLLRPNESLTRHSKYYYNFSTTRDKQEDILVTISSLVTDQLRM
jgi:hypothetical protein